MGENWLALIQEIFMSPRQILARLCAMGKGTSKRHEPLTCDRLDQEELYQLQEDLTSLMEDLSKEIPNGGSYLNRMFPHVFKLVHMSLPSPADHV
jgi:hypothetical protein